MFSKNLDKIRNVFQFFKDFKAILSFFLPAARFCRATKKGMSDIPFYTFTTSSTFTLASA